MLAPQLIQAVLLNLVLAAPGNAGAADTGSCAVTVPNEQTYSEEPPGGNHGNDYLVVGLPTDGTVVFRPGGPGRLLEDGALSMKFWWWRRVSGNLLLTGRRIDAKAPALRSVVLDGYGDRGFQAVALVFPTTGCWEVTGSVGSGTLTFVTRVVKQD